jgi:hypothetical protein
MTFVCSPELEMVERPTQQGMLTGDRILLINPVRTLIRTLVGTWLSLVEHSLGVRGVGSSNLPVPTNTFCSLFRKLRSDPSIAFELSHDVDE